MVEKSGVKVTVYIASHNYGKYLQDAINSVLRQTMDSWELLLVNDNSSDNTEEIMEIYRGDSRVRIFKTKGLGLPAVANLALNEANGKYLIRLDADDVFDENILLVLSHYLDIHPDIALVFPDFYLIDEFNGLLQHDRRNPIHKSNHMYDMPANGACTMIKKSVLNKVGGYREDLGAQDGFDIWTKIINEHKCRNINLPLFYYRRHGLNLTENTQRILSARRAIKKDAALSALEKMRPIISVIPCRTNYDIFPNLWSQDINGKTLLDIALETVTASSVFDKIIVASDNEDVQKVMENYNDSRLCFVTRDPELTIPSCSIVSTLEMIVRDLNINWEGISVLSYLQSPFTSTDNLEEAVYTLVLNEADASFAVEEIKVPLYKRSVNGLVPINNTGTFLSDFDVVYSAATTSLATKNKNLKRGSLTGAKIVNFIVPREEAFIINTKKDFEVARQLKKL